LQNDIEKKEEILESRGKEVNEFRTKIDVLGAEITRLETAIQQAKAEANSAVVRIATLEVQLKDKDETLRAKESTFKGFERNFTAKIQNLESEIKNKEKLLADQHKQIDDLNCQLETLRNGIKGMSSFFRQAEALTAVEAHGASRVAPDEQSKAREVNPASSPSTAPKATSTAADASRELVPASFFDTVIKDLSEILGPFSSLIVRDHVKTLGESMEKFPKARVTELAKSLSEEIGNERLRIGFRQRLSDLAITEETASVSSTKSNS
jgi:phage shock protein A